MANSNIARVLEPPETLDNGLAEAMHILRAAGIKPYKGYVSFEPAIKFIGGSSEGFRAFAAAAKAGLPVSGIRKAWTVNNDGELAGPVWEIIFSH
jgi:hypothetical protein